MRERIYIATFANEAIETIALNNLNIEFNHLCISANLDDENIDNTLIQMNRDWEKCKRCKAIIHGPFTELSPDSMDPKVVDLTYTRLEQAYAVSKKMGVKKMVVHSGYMPFLYFKEWHVERSVDFWRDFIKDKPEDFNLAIENVFEDEPFLMRELIEKIGDKRVKACLDVGHANVFIKDKLNVIDWIETLGPYISHIHMHNNDGNKDLHNSIDNGSMNIGDIFDGIEKNCSRDTTITIESMDCKSSILWMKNNNII